jgi:hypothetical protein
VPHLATQPALYPNTGEVLQFLLREGFRRFLGRIIAVLLSVVGVANYCMEVVHGFASNMSLRSALSTLAVAIGISFWLLVGCVPVVPPPPPRPPPPSYPHYSPLPPRSEPDFSVPPARPEPPRFEQYPLPPAPEPGFSVPSRPPTDLHPGVPRIEGLPPPSKQPDQPPEWVNPPPMDENP